MKTSHALSLFAAVGSLFALVSCTVVEPVPATTTSTTVQTQRTVAAPPATATTTTTRSTGY